MTTSTPATTSAGDCKDHDDMKNKPSRCDASSPKGPGREPEALLHVRIDNAKTVTSPAMTILANATKLRIHNIEMTQAWSANHTRAMVHLSRADAG